MRTILLRSVVSVSARRDIVVTIVENVMMDTGATKEIALVCRMIRSQIIMGS